MPEKKDTRAGTADTLCAKRSSLRMRLRRYLLHELDLPVGPRRVGLCLLPEEFSLDGAHLLRLELLEVPPLVGDVGFIKAAPRRPDRLDKESCIVWHVRRSPRQTKLRLNVRVLGLEIPLLDKLC